MSVGGPGGSPSGFLQGCVRAFGVLGYTALVGIGTARLFCKGNGFLNVEIACWVSLWGSFGRPRCPLGIKAAVFPRAPGRAIPIMTTSHFRAQNCVGPKTVSNPPPPSSLHIPNIDPVSNLQPHSGIKTQIKVIPDEIHWYHSIAEFVKLNLGKRIPSAVAPLCIYFSSSLRHFYHGWGADRSMVHQEAVIHGEYVASANAHRASFRAGFVDVDGSASIRFANPQIPIGTSPLISAW